MISRFVLNRGYAEDASFAELLLINDHKTFATVEEGLRAFLADFEDWRQKTIAKAEQDESKYEYLKPGWAGSIRKAWDKPIHEVITDLWQGDRQWDVVDLFDYGWNFTLEAMNDFGQAQYRVAIIHRAPSVLEYLATSPDNHLDESYIDIYEMTSRRLKPNEKG